MCEKELLSYRVVVRQLSSPARRYELQDGYYQEMGVGYASRPEM